MGMIHEALPRIAGRVGAIGKNRKNEQQKYSFRGIDDMYNALNGLMAEEGVFSVPEVQDIRREERVTKSGTALMYTILTVKYTLYAKDGSSVVATLTGEGMDSGDKSCNKALAGAQKYLFLQVFSIPTEEPKDSELDSHEVVSKLAGGNVASSPRPSPEGSPASPVNDTPVAESTSPVTAGEGAPSAPGSYVIEGGIHKGKALRDLTDDQRNKTFDWCRQHTGASWAERFMDHAIKFNANPSELPF